VKQLRKKFGVELSGFQYRSSFFVVASITFAHPLFLAQNPHEQNAASPYFPLGLLYLASYVREQGHQVTIFDGTFETDESAFEAHLAKHKPDVVGISALVTSRTTALRLAAMAAPTAVVVLGGPDPTSDPAAYLADENVDIVVHHEGEQTIARLLELADAAKLNTDTLASEPGIAFRLDGQVHTNQPRPPIENLDELPLPARDLIDMERYMHQWQDSSGYTSITVATSRGCPFGCEWCRDSVHGDGFRQRSPDNVAAEMQQLKERYGVESIRIVDDVDGLDRSWIDEWATAATELDAVIPFESLNRLDRTDLPLLEVRDSL